MKTITFPTILVRNNLFVTLPGIGNYPLKSEKGHPLMGGTAHAITMEQILITIS